MIPQEGVQVNGSISKKRQVGDPSAGVEAQPRHCCKDTLVSGDSRVLNGDAGPQTVQEHYSGGVYVTKTSCIVNGSVTER